MKTLIKKLLIIAAVALVSGGIMIAAGSLIDRAFPSHVRESRATATETQIETYPPTEID